ncbi:MAG: cupin domain-containing protein [Lentimicrobiaceae bacterium]|jgi:predicted cupin superfamily sugar epimerase|nr:cupin domain-containing protein [Lentimicrobiaceae bacterium]
MDNLNSDRTTHLINQLQLLPHPEGGFYKETYRSDVTATDSKGAKRNVCTSIYYLLNGTNKSHFHRIPSDELWYFHEGETLEIIYIQHSELTRVLLGKNTQNGEHFYIKIPANVWFAAKIKSEKSYTLVSCVVAPGFDFKDFELAERNTLLNAYPLLKDIIEEFTR